MLIIEDMGQKERMHEAKHHYWLRHGIDVRRYPLPVGDYVLGDEAVTDVIRRKEARDMRPKKMDFLGSYKVAVDTKYSVDELVMDICGKQHARFRDECILAKQNGIKLFILVENTLGIRDLEGVKNWKNSRMNRYLKIQKMHSLGRWQDVKLPAAPPTSGETLYKAAKTMNERYGVEFLFDSPDLSGRRIIKLLTEGKDA